MIRPPSSRILILIVATTLGLAGCTELPNDVGVRRHLSVAVQTRRASGHPLFSSWNDDEHAKGTPKILVNITTQQAFFYRGKVLVGKTNISSGRKDFETPPGTYRVIQKDEHHVSNEYGAYVAESGAILVRNADINRDPRPEGARFVGAPMPFFLRFTEGYGMHAGFVPRYRASHGCIRMPSKMAQHFFATAEIGTRVEVVEPPIMVGR